MHFNIKDLNILLVNVRFKTISALQSPIFKGLIGLAGDFEFVLSFQPVLSFRVNMRNLSFVFVSSDLTTRSLVCARDDKKEDVISNEHEKSFLCFPPFNDQISHGSLC